MNVFIIFIAWLFGTRSQAINLFLTSPFYVLISIGTHETLVHLETILEFIDLILIVYKKKRCLRGGRDNNRNSQKTPNMEIFQVCLAPYISIIGVTPK